MERFREFVELICQVVFQILQRKQKQLIFNKICQTFPNRLLNLSLSDDYRQQYSFSYKQQQMTQRKNKLLKKYLGEVKSKRQNLIGDSLKMKDNQVDLNESLSSQNNQSEDDAPKRKRVRSDSQSNEEPIKLKIQNDQHKKSKRVSKGIRKALGLKKGQEAQQFLDAVQIEGISMQELEKYLKNNKQGLKIQSKQQRKLNKKQEKQKERDQQKVKIQYEQESSSSDLVIPEQARTIYRNKDGSIRQVSQVKAKQIKNQQVLKRLGQWEKGMKQESSQQEERVDIWDDPAKRWHSKSKHPLRCAFTGSANRFDIKPGFRWDGVIRGNGFQTKYLQEANLRKLKATQEDRQYLKNL